MIVRPIRALILAPRAYTLTGGPTGHCWSDETQLPALRRGPSASLHPSAAPKCTHAYALSRRGARRALLHLRHPPFAYSRAIDQALAWLVRSGRLRAFSVVPPVVVQRKDSSSDVMPGRGSEWRQGLENGVLDSMRGRGSESRR